MGIAERKDRERAERERRIVATARAIAEGEGWQAVTIRRLAAEIEYSQPVLYAHFENRDAIVAAVAIEGFREFAAAIRLAASEAAGRTGAARNVALAYLAFARERPALYAAMFTLPTSLRFAQGRARPEMREAFAAIAAVVPPAASDVELTTETFWAALHGLAELDRSGRVRESARAERVALLVRALVDGE